MHSVCCVCAPIEEVTTRPDRTHTQTHTKAGIQSIGGTGGPIGNAVDISLGTIECLCACVPAMGFVSISIYALCVKVHTHTHPLTRNYAIFI